VTAGAACAHRYGIRLGPVNVALIMRMPLAATCAAKPCYRKRIAGERGAIKSESSSEVSVPSGLKAIRKIGVDAATRMRLPFQRAFCDRPGAIDVRVLKAIDGTTSLARTCLR